MMFEKSITKQEINELPLFKYEGKTIIAATEKQIDKAIFEIEEFCKAICPHFFGLYSFSYFSKQNYFKRKTSTDTLTSP